MKGYKGFTLIEVIVIMAVIAILAAMAIPAALRIFQATAENTTRDEMENIKKAMIGDPQKLQSSFRSDFSYLGDIGCLPSTTVGGLDRLLTQGGLPSWFFSDATTDPANNKQAGAGWKGPYITGTPGEDFKKDQWGNDYVYTAAGACPLTAQLTSNGPDGQAGTGDDITITIASGETTATVRGKVKDTAGLGLQGVSVELYSATNNGTLTTTPATTDANGEYTFLNVPFGPRAVRALPGLVFSPGSVVITGGGNSDISFKVVNYSTSAFQIDQFNANFGPPNPDPNYDQIRTNSNTVDSGSNFDSQETVSLTASPAANRTIAASPVSRPSIRVVVDSFDTQLSDTIVSGQGTAGTIEINDFNANMTGTPFTVTFFGPGGITSIVKFTP